MNKHPILNVLKNQYKKQHLPSKLQCIASERNGDILLIKKLIKIKHWSCIRVLDPAQIGTGVFHRKALNITTCISIVYDVHNKYFLEHLSKKTVTCMDCTIYTQRHIHVYNFESENFVRFPPSHI